MSRICRSRSDAVGVGHAQIHERHVGGMARERGDRLGRRRADHDLESGRLRQPLHHGADDRFIVDDEQDRPTPHAGPFNVARHPAAVEDGAHVGHELDRGERFLQMRLPAVEIELARHGFGRVAGHVDHLEGGLRGGQPPEQLRTAHARHDDVSDEQIDLAAMLGEDRFRVRPAGGVDHAVARHARAAAARAARTPASSSTSSTSSSPRAGGATSIGGALWSMTRLARGRYTVKDAPRPGFAVRPDIARALLDDAVDGREAEAGALARLLGREEGFEQMRAWSAGPCPRRYRRLAASHTSPASTICSGRPDLAFSSTLAVLMRQAAALLHGVARVDAEVDHDLFELSGDRLAPARGPGQSPGRA